MKPESAFIGWSFMAMILIFIAIICMPLLSNAVIMLGVAIGVYGTIFGSGFLLPWFIDKPKDVDDKTEVWFAGELEPVEVVSHEVIVDPTKPKARYCSNCGVELEI